MSKAEDAANATRQSVGTAVSTAAGVADQAKKAANEAINQGVKAADNQLKEAEHAIDGAMKVAGDTVDQKLKEANKYADEQREHLAKVRQSGAKILSSSMEMRIVISSIVYR